MNLQVGTDRGLAGGVLWGARAGGQGDRGPRVV